MNVLFFFLFLQKYSFSKVNAATAWFTTMRGLRIAIIKRKTVLQWLKISKYGFQRLFLFRLSMDIPYQNSNFHNFAETRFRLISCVRVNEMPECDDK